MWNNIAGSARVPNFGVPSSVCCREQNRKIERQENCERRTRWPWKRIETHEGDSEFSRVVQFWRNEEGASAQGGRRGECEDRRRKAQGTVGLVNRWKGVQLGQSRKRGKSEPFLESINSLAPCLYILSFPLSLPPSPIAFRYTCRYVARERKRVEIKSCAELMLGLSRAKWKLLEPFARIDLTCHLIFPSSFATYTCIRKYSGLTENHFTCDCCLLEISDETANIYSSTQESGGD